VRGLYERLTSKQRAVLLDIAWNSPRSLDAAHAGPDLSAAIAKAIDAVRYDRREPDFTEAAKVIREQVAGRFKSQQSVQDRHLKNARDFQVPL
jgi:hypothetical protein